MKPYFLWFFKGFQEIPFFWQIPTERRPYKFVRYRSQIFIGAHCMAPCNVMTGFIIFCAIDKVPKIL